MNKVYVQLIQLSSWYVDCLKQWEYVEQKARCLMKPQIPSQLFPILFFNVCIANTTK
jgi:hypothetical protein